MKQVKKVFNVEYDLTSTEFKDTKQDMISEKCQAMHPDYICKVTTFCVPDKQLVVATTEENRAFMGASDKLLAHRPLAEQSFMNLDDDMVRTYEITITADTNLPDYLTAIDVAQAKADEMFEADDSKLPLVTVIDYRWGNAPATLSASVFGDVDENGNIVPLINANAPMTVLGGNNTRGNLQLYAMTEVINIDDIVADKIYSMFTQDYYIDVEPDIHLTSPYSFYIEYNGTDCGATDSYSPSHCMFGDNSGSVYTGLGMDNGKMIVSGENTPFGEKIDDGKWHKLLWTTDGQGNWNLFQDGTHIGSVVWTTGLEDYQYIRKVGIGHTYDGTNFNYLIKNPEIIPSTLTISDCISKTS